MNSPSILRSARPPSDWSLDLLLCWWVSGLTVESRNLNTPSAVAVAIVLALWSGISMWRWIRQLRARDASYQPPLHLCICGSSLLLICFRNSIDSATWSKMRQIQILWIVAAALAITVRIIHALGSDGSRPNISD